MTNYNESISENPNYLIYLQVFSEQIQQGNKIAKNGNGETPNGNNTEQKRLRGSGSK